MLASVSFDSLGTYNKNIINQESQLFSNHGDFRKLEFVTSYLTLEGNTALELFEMKMN